MLRILESLREVTLVDNEMISLAYGSPRLRFLECALRLLFATVIIII